MYCIYGVESQNFSMYDRQVIIFIVATLYMFDFGGKTPWRIPGPRLYQNILLCPPLSNSWTGLHDLKPFPEFYLFLLCIDCTACDNLKLDIIPIASG